MSFTKTKTKTLPLIRLEKCENDPKKKFTVTVDPESIKMLRTLNCFVAILTFVGEYRKGKSYYLGRMILQDDSNPFTVDPGVNACTRGLWISFKMIEHIAPDGTRFVILGIDSEGLDAVDATADNTYNNIIFMLTMLISDAVVYNIPQLIKESNIETLYVALQSLTEIRITNNDLTNSRTLTKRQRVEEELNDHNDDTEMEQVSQQQREKELNEIMPHCMFFLRDFSMDLEGKTYKQYLDSVLSDVPTSETKTRHRQMIKNCFANGKLSCEATICPVSDTNLLKVLDKLPESQLNPQFIRDGERIRKWLFNECIKYPKRIQGKYVDGNGVADMIEMFVNKINADGAIPVLEDAWTMMNNNKCQRMYDQSIKTWESSFQDGLTKGFTSTDETNVTMFDPEKLENMLIQAARKIQDKFASAVTPSEIATELSSKLKDELQKRMQQLLSLNMSLLKRWMDSQISRFEQFVQSDKCNTFEQFCIRLMEFEKLIVSRCTTTNTSDPITSISPNNNSSMTLCRFVDFERIIKWATYVHEKQCTSLNTKLEELQQEKVAIDALKLKWEKMQESMTMKDEELLKLKMEIDLMTNTLNDETHKHKMEKQSINDEHELKMKQLSHELQLSQTQLQDLQESMTKQSAEQNALLQEKEALFQQQTMVIQDLNDKQLEFARERTLLVEQFEDLQRQLGMIKYWKDKYDAAEQRNSELQNDLLNNQESTRQNDEAFNNQLAQMKVQMLEEMKSMAQQAQNTKQEMMHACQKIKLQQQADRAKHIEESKGFNEQIVNLEQRLSKTIEENKTLDERNTTFRHEKERLTKTLQDLQEENQRTIIKLRSEYDDRYANQREIEAKLRGQLTELQINTTASIQKLQGDNNLLQTKLSDLHKRHEETSNDITRYHRLREEYSKLQATRSEEINSLKLLKIQHDDLQTKYNTLVQQLKTKEQELAASIKQRELDRIRADMTQHREFAASENTRTSNFLSQLMQDNNNTNNNNNSNKQQTTNNSTTTQNSIFDRPQFKL